MNTGRKMYNWMVDLFPINRSLTGAGVRKTLNYIKKEIPKLQIQSVPTGYQAFDWEVPKEWSVKDAYIADSNGEKIVDFRNSNLHIIGYSIPVDKNMKGSELLSYLHYLPDQPEAIPYLTSYYRDRWGFCVTKEQYDYVSENKSDIFQVLIDSEHFDGELNYGELLIPGNSEKEILLSTYICHPSMANNELSGPVMATALAKEISSWPEREYSYRIIFVPETIGSIIYISKHLAHLKQNVIGGYVLTCVGDNENYSILNSKYEANISERIAIKVLEDNGIRYKQYPFSERGSDERQFCSPGVDLPITSLMRTKYGEYREYHTSLDDLNFVSPEGLQGAFDVLLSCLIYFEQNVTPMSDVLCEPQLSKRGLYPSLSTKQSAQKVRMMMNIISYSDGKLSLLDICEKHNYDFSESYKIVNQLAEKGVLRYVS